MYLQNLPNELKEGVMVSNVDPNSAASKAGLQFKMLLFQLMVQKLRIQMI